MGHSRPSAPHPRELAQFPVVTEGCGLITLELGDASIVCGSAAIEERQAKYPLRYLVLAGLLASPSFLPGCLDGSSATTVAYFALMTLYGLVEWVATRRLRHLIYLAFGAALLILTCLHMTLLLFVVFALLRLHQVRVN